MEFRRVQRARVSFDELDASSFVPNNVPFAASKYTKTGEEEPVYSDEDEIDWREEAQEKEGKNKKDKKKDKDDLDKGDLELKVVIAKTPTDRQRWLTRILKAANNGQIKNRLSSLYDIVSHRKFAAGLDDHRGRRMRYEILKKAHLFSSKQQQFLKSANWPMEKEFGGEAKPEDREGDGEGHAKAENRVSSEAESQASVGFNFGASSSKAPQSTSATGAPAASSAPTEVKIGGVDTSAVLAMLQKTAAFAAGAAAPKASQSTSAPAAPAAPSAAAAAPAGVKTGGVDTSAVLSMLQKTAAFAASVRPEGDGTQKSQVVSMKSAPQAAADEQSASNVAPKQDVSFSMKTKEVSKDRDKSVFHADEQPAPSAPPMEASKEKGMYIPERLPEHMRMTQSEFDAKFEQKTRSVSKKNPDHEGLSHIKEQIMAERGLARPRSRSRRRDRDRQQDPGIADGQASAPGTARPRSRSRRRERRDRDGQQDQRDGGRPRH